MIEIIGGRSFMHRVRTWSLPFIVILVIAGLGVSCGDGKKSKSPATSPPGPMALALSAASQQHRIPLDILLALAYKETRLNSDPSRTRYPNSEGLRGPSLAETIVGLPLATLGLGESAAGQSKVQLNAYGAWVRQQLESQRIELPTALSKADDVYDWIWQLARMHHREPRSPKNLQILFAREMIQILNTGFIWQDASTRERIELKPRPTRLEISNFSPPIQANLKLDTRASEIFFVDYMQLTFERPNNVSNRPQRILITHCPFSLTTCLGSQLQKDGESSIRFQAHYIIPPDDSILTRPIKVLQHQTPVTITDTNGQTQTLTDTVIVMLVGPSGRYVNGQRLQSNPSWYTRRQLKYMGEVVSGICQLMAQDDPTIDIARCRTPGQGVQFQNDRPGQGYRFGEIPDFDASIFWSFIRNPDDLSGDVAIQLPINQKVFQAGAPIATRFAFIKGTAKLEIQRLERCSSGQTVWAPLQTHFIRSSDNKTVDLTLYDQGPNENGQHYIRALVFDSEGGLMGWAVQDFFLTAYDTDGIPGPSLELCTP